MSSLKDFKCMCNNISCDACKIRIWCEDDGRISELPDNVDEIVDKWVQEQPVKTYAQDFFRHFPNAKRASNGTPEVCRDNLYNNGCPDASCKDCWNQRMK